MRYTHKSIILWPDEVSTGRCPNTSEDSHISEEHAKIVCRILEKKGLGCNGKIFPISTRVKKIEEEVQCDI